MSDPFQVVRDFEAALCEYTGAKYAVTTTSCTMALLLACAWHKGKVFDSHIEIPRFTYCSVPMSVRHARFAVRFRDENWVGEYQLKDLPIWDCARWFRKGMYRAGQFMACSFHWTKHLAVGQGGCVLHDNPEADVWLRRARFDGRTEGVAPKDDVFTMIGHHCYMSPRDAAEGLSRLAVLPDYNPPLPNDDYPDLSKMDIFK